MKTLKAIRQVGGGFLKKFELHYDAGGQDVCWEVISLNVIDGNETPQEAAGRELKEETGLEMVRVDRQLPPACYSVGLTDEIIVPLFVTVRGSMRPCDEAYEEIVSRKMSLQDIRALMAQENVKITETCMLILAMLTMEK